MSHERIYHPGLLDYEDMMKLLKCSRSTIKRLVQTGDLPAPDRIKGVGVRWWEDDVSAYLYRLKQNRRQGDSGIDQKK